MPTLEHPLLVPAIRLDRDDGTEEATALRRATEPWAAGFLLFGGEVEQVTALTARLRDAAGRPLFIASDMERGAGQQVKGLTELPDAGLVGLAGSPADAHAFGEITAREARSVGIDVVFAPVVDVRSEILNPIVGNRAYGWSPERVGALAAAFCLGAHAGGAVPVAKHYPGHGATAEDSHDAVPVVREAADVLRTRDLAPFQTVIEVGRCAAFMTAHVSYPTLDASGAVATFSWPILHPRETEWGADFGELAGVLFTDALLMTGAAGSIGEVEAARRALWAGCHGLLYPESPERVARELLDAEHVDLDREIEIAAHRLTGLAGWIERPIEGEAPAGLWDVPAAVARGAVDLALGGEGGGRPDALWILDDDDIASRGLVLERRAREAQVPCEIVRVSQGDRPGLGLGDAAEGVVVVMAGVGAWKGASGVRPETERAVESLRWTQQESRRDVRVIWCAPRGAECDLHLPGTGPHLEAALADLLFGCEEA